MKILLDAIPLCNLLTGISRYVRNLYVEMEKLPEAEIHYFDGKRIHRKMPRQADAVRWAQKTERIWKLPDAAVFGLRAITWLIYEYKVNRRIESNRYDIHHETAFTPVAQNACPQVFTLHDLSLMRYPETHPKERVWFSDFFFKRRIMYASHVVTVSEFVKREICEKLNIPSGKVTAIPEAADPFFSPRRETEISMMKRQFRIPEDYLLFVGTLEPRKNLKTLLKALEICKEKIPLVLAGWSGWGDKEWMKNTGAECPIFPLGYVDEEDLARLYCGAKALIYPSIYEGFGLPVLEAMACGTPVICSNAASLPEVAGEAAILVDPMNVESFSNAIASIWKSSDLRKKKAQACIEHSKEFSWSETAHKTYTTFKEIAFFK